MESTVKGNAGEAAKSSFSGANISKILRSEVRMVKKEFLGFFIFAWISYGLMTRYGQLKAHFIHPDPTKWTDAELGIPPDSSPDS